MLNEELNNYIDDKLAVLKQEQKDLRKSECLEYASTLGCMGLFFLGDIDHIISGDNYQGVAIGVDILLSSIAWAIISSVFENCRDVDKYNLQDQISFLKSIKRDLDKGVNDYKNVSLERFEEGYKLLFDNNSKPFERTRNK